MILVVKFLQQENGYRFGGYPLFLPKTKHINKFGVSLSSNHALYSNSVHNLYYYSLLYDDVYRKDHNCGLTPHSMQHCCALSEHSKLDSVVSNLTWQTYLHIALEQLYTFIHAPFYIISRFALFAVICIGAQELHDFCTYHLYGYMVVIEQKR